MHFFVGIDVTQHTRLHVLAGILVRISSKAFQEQRAQTQEETLTTINTVIHFDSPGNVFISSRTLWLRPTDWRDILCLETSLSRVATYFWDELSR